MIGQSETLSSRHIIFITLFSAGGHRCWAKPQTSHRKLFNYAEPKLFSGMLLNFFI
jgi:hypothetical protein